MNYILSFGPAFFSFWFSKRLKVKCKNSQFQFLIDCLQTWNDYKFPLCGRTASWLNEMDFLQYFVCICMRFFFHFNKMTHFLFYTLQENQLVLAFGMRIITEIVLNATNKNKIKNGPKNQMRKIPGRHNNKYGAHKIVEWISYVKVEWYFYGYLL